MADEIVKFLARVTDSERILLTKLIEAIVADTISTGDIKKLSGSADVFRLRKGKFRIIYRKNKKEITIISINRRNEKTYRDF
jgi:mRNA-degrading endonuclease RelE of RelBE toxin-antitoxin system